MKRLLARAATVLAFALFAGCGDDDPPTTGGETLLTSPAIVTGIAGAGGGSQRLYRIVVPAGATEISVTTSGGTGDVDLYVRAGQPPTPGAFDCESNEFDNDETCTLASPTAGNWYIVLLGFDAYSGVTLTATVSTP